MLNLILGASLLLGSVALVSVTVYKFLDKKEVKKQAKINCPSALKAVIQKKKDKALKVGIFDNNSREISTELEINAPYGVSDSLRVGDVIMVR